MTKDYKIYFSTNFIKNKINKQSCINFIVIISFFYCVGFEILELAEIYIK